jgi:hypothetical protein
MIRVRCGACGRDGEISLERMEAEARGFLAPHSYVVCGCGAVRLVRGDGESIDATSPDGPAERAFILASRLDGSVEDE